MSGTQNLALSALMLVLLIHYAVQQDDHRNDPSWTVEGNVVDASGHPVARAEVAAVAPQDNLSASADDKGHYILQGLAPGQYWIYARKNGYSLGPSRRASLLRGMTLEHFDLRLPKGAALSGRVLDSDKNPVANIVVDVWVKDFTDGRSSVSFAGSARTDETGSYRVTGLSTGNYYVGANPGTFRAKTYDNQDSNQKRTPEYSFRRVFYAGGTSLDSATPVHLETSEQREGLDLFLERVPTFCVTASTSLDGAAPRDSTISVWLSETSKGWSHSIGGGDIRLGQQFEICGLVPRYPYSLTASLWENDTDVSVLATKDFFATQREADLGLLDVGVLSLEHGQRLKGKIVIETQGHDEVVPRGINVALDPVYRYNIHNESRTAEAESSGNFSFASVLPDEHWLRILGLPPGLYVKRAVFRGHDLLREPFRPDSGEMEIILSHGSSLNGRVVDKDNHPVNDAQVIVAPKDPSSGRPIARQSDQEGRFQFPSNLAPGDYRIVAVVGVRDRELENPDIANVYLSQGVDLNLAPQAQHALTLTVITPN